MYVLLLIRVTRVYPSVNGTVQLVRLKPYLRREQETMFWKKDRDKEQEEKARKIQESTRKNQDIQEELRQAQAQATAKVKEAEQLQKELNQAKADKREESTAQRQKMNEMRKEMAQMRQKLDQVEQAASAQEPDEDIEELTAAQQAEARAGAQRELEEARRRVQELDKAIGPAEGLMVGNTAWVRKAGGKGLNRRDAPGLKSNVLDSLTIGSQLSLLEGPNPVDGYTWWRVRASDGREGWVAGEELVTQPE